MYCWHCGKRLREDGEFCSACGMIVVKPAEESGKTEAAEQKVHTLLAEANLLRLRKEWQAAILRCTEALKIAPNSASAHSLLGDICRDEGRPREAMEWYRQALTLEPTRRLDREKLDALIDLTYGSERGGEEGALLSRELSKRRMWMDSGLRIAVSALAAVIFVALSAFLLNYPYSQKTLTELPAPTLIPRPARPVSPEQDADREIQTLPQQTEVPVAPPAPVLPRQSGSAPAAAPRQPETAAEPPRAQESIAEREERLAEALSWEAENASPWAEFLGVSIDPRSGDVDISFSLPEEEALQETQERILEVSLRLASAAAAQEAALQKITVRAHLQLETEEGADYEPAFIGESSAEILRTVSPEQISAQRAQQVFTNIWWEPSLADSEE